MFLIWGVTLPDPTWLEMIGSYAWNILSVGAGLTFVIFVHELGHFLVAKACGVKCEKFYVGFDFFEFKLGPFKIPRALIKFQWGETEYGLGSLPLGGYVKMLGQDDDPRNAEAEAARIRGGDSDKARAEAIASGLAAEGLVPGKSVEAATEEAAAAALASPQEGPDAPVPAQTVTGHTVLLDPRSYPAKPIPARMAIISAGVIMNLIFAVILAAAAYKLGVKETPAIIGGTAPGGAPWKLGVEPGSKVIQIGKSGQPYEFIRWEDFQTVAILNEDQDVPMLVVAPDGQKEWYNFRPTKNPATDRPMIGVTGPRDRQVNIYPEVAAHLNPNASPPLQDFDLIEEVAGQTVTNGEDIAKILCQQPLGKVTIKVRRPTEEESEKPPAEWASSPKTIETTLEAKPMRELGIAMKMGPILAIRDGSPAAAAGFMVDDVIVEIDGEPVGDPLSLSQRLTPTNDAAEPLTIVVSRKDRAGKPSQKTLTVTPERPLQSSSMFMNPAAIEPIGVAFRVTNEVEEIDPEGPAAKSGLKKGDVLTKVAFVPGRAETPTNELKQLRGPILFDEIEFSDSASWAEVFTRLQFVFPETKVKLTWTRGKAESSAELQPRDSKTFFDDMRGLELYPVVTTHKAAGWGEAFQLGLRETKDRLMQVVMILHRLVTGRLSPTNLSGPAGIIYAAGRFASEGLPALLIFLTILSANLAILNFLPIPALDGGHMLFLTAEAIRGKPVDERLQMRLTVFGVLCLLSLMVFATAMDVGRFYEMFMNWFS